MNGNDLIKRILDENLGDAEMVLSLSDEESATTEILEVNSGTLDNGDEGGFIVVDYSDLAG